MKKLIPFLFLLFAYPAFGQEDFPAGENFSFRLVSTPGSIELQSENGCNWLTLSFSLWENGDPIFINQTGMLGSDSGSIEEHLKTSIFLIHIMRTSDGLHFKSFLGTRWVELKRDCLEEYCSFQVMDTGIKAFVD